MRHLGPYGKAREARIGARTYLFPIVTIVDGPPSPEHLIVRRVAGTGISALCPGLVGTNEVSHVDARLEVLVRGEILVVGGRGDVVGETQAVVAVLEMHIQETLVGSVERDSPLGHGHHGVVVAHVRRQGHDTRVEEVGPPDIGGGREVMGKVEELVGRPVSHGIGVYVYNLAELGLLPEVDLGECRVQVGPVHEVQVGGLAVPDPGHGYDIVVNSLRGSNWCQQERPSYGRETKSRS